MSVYTKAREIAEFGGPPLPLPQTLNDLEPIRIRWAMMFTYEPETGDLLLKIKLATAKRPDLIAREDALATNLQLKGNKRVKMLRVDGFSVRAADYVWFIHHDRWPKGRLGKRDEDSLNDRIENLFEFTAQPALTGTGRGRQRIRPVGVCRFYDRWRAYVDLPNGKRKYLGSHATEDAAAAARRLYDAAQDLV